MKVRWQTYEFDALMFMMTFGVAFVVHLQRTNLVWQYHQREAGEGAEALRTRQDAVLAKYRDTMRKRRMVIRTTSRNSNTATSAQQQHCKKSLLRPPNLPPRSRILTEIESANANCTR